MNEDTVQFSKIDKRKISAFMAKEMLFDFDQGRLSESEVSTLKELIAKNPQLGQELDGIKDAKKYLNSMSEIQIPPTVEIAFSTELGYLDVLLSKMKVNQWPNVLKVGLESLVVVLMMASVFVVTPWERIVKWIHRTTQTEIVLTEIVRQKTVDLDSPQIPADTSVQPFPDEGAKSTKNLGNEGDKSQNNDSENVKKLTQPKQAGDTVVVGTEPQVPNVKKITSELGNGAAKQPVASKSDEIKSVKDSSPGVPKSESKVADNLKNAKMLAQKVTENQASNEESEESGNASEAGFLYRGVFSVTNLEYIGPKITEKIMELGGRKAGNVEIGWKKGPNSFYYHFTMPEAKYSELVKYMALYGKPSLSKDPHSRVMPEGIVRILMTIEEKEE